MRIFLLSILLLFISLKSFASIESYRFEKQGFNTSPFRLSYNDNSLVVFDIPIAYNKYVRKWMRYFQTEGNERFKIWLQRSSKHIPHITSILEREKLPKDLVYLSMIESGFSPKAESVASAVGPWQFIKPTAKRYGLKVNWWLDERRDFDKSTKAAAKYLKDLYKLFGSWYLVAAGYNSGENLVKRMIKKHKTKNFWTLSKNNALYKETQNYVPQWIAAALIAKAPYLYGFRKINYQRPLEIEHFVVPGGTDLKSLADYIGVTHTALSNLNPELKVSYIPPHVSSHRIKIPKGSYRLVSSFFRARHFRMR